MTKYAPMTDAQKKANIAKSLAKYKDKIKDDEIFCEACMCPVKRLSLFNHNKGKKHIEKSKSVVKDIVSVFKKALAQLETGINTKETAREVFYYLKNEYFDENENEILEESEIYAETDAKTPEEKEFCSQMFSYMMHDTDEMIEAITDANLYEGVQAQLDKVDGSKPSAKQQLLAIFRRIKNQEKTKQIKTIDLPKKVEPKKEEIVLTDDFPMYSQFCKASDKSKLKCLKDIIEYHQYIFSESIDLNTVIEIVEAEEPEDYNICYKHITVIKSDYDASLIADAEDEECEED